MALQVSPAPASGPAWAGGAKFQGHPAKSMILAAVGLLLGLATLDGASIAFGTPSFTETFSVRPENSRAADSFGYSIAMDGNTLAVGAPGTDRPSSSTGSVYVYDVESRSFAHELLASNRSGFTNLGRDVAVQGDLILGGAPSHTRREGGFVDGAGAAYSFSRASGSQSGLFYSPYFTSGQGFGSSVAVSGTNALFGATGQGGRAYVFDLETNNRTLELLPPPGQSGNGFGEHVALSGDFAIVGGFVYSAITGEYLHRLTPSDGSRIITTSVDNGRLLAGTPLTSVDGLNRVGQAFLFDIATGQELARFGPTAIDEEARFGSSVSLLGNLALIGAPSTFSTSGPPDYSSGEAYLFNVESGELLALLQASDQKPEDYFGWSVALGENWAAVGALDPASGLSNAGAVYLYDLSTIPEPAVIGLIFHAIGFGLLHRRRPRGTASNAAG